MNSDGVKRLVAAVLSIVIGILTPFPSLQPVILVLTYIAGIFGITGLIHATVSLTLLHAVAATLASLIATILLASQFIPQIQPYVPLLQQIALWLGSLAAGYSLARGTATPNK